MGDFANALAGFGAGFQGRGAEWAAQQQERERQQALSDLFNSSGAAQGEIADPGALLQGAAKIDPQYLGAYATYAAQQQKAKQPDWQTKVADGKFYRWNANDPNSVPTVTTAGGGDGGSIDTKGEVVLRKEFESLQPVKDFRALNDAYKKIEAVGTAEPSATNDMALVFSLMKIYDPNSVVRETEYATAENARGVPESIAAEYNKVIDGQRLSPQQRENFLATANDLFAAQATSYNELANKYQGLAKDYGYEPNRISTPAPISLRIPKELKAPDRMAREPIQPTSNLSRDEWLKRRPK